MRDWVRSQFRDSAAVFVGTVESLHGSEGREETDDLVTFRVARWFKGGQGTFAEVHSSIGRKWVSSCGYSFQMGKEYVVFASRFEQRLSAHACSLTTPREQADGILRYLRGHGLQPEDRLSPGEHQHLMLARTTGKICGALRRFDGGRLGRVTLNILSSDGEVRSARGWLAEFDEQQGTFCIAYLSPGSYQLTAVVEEDGQDQRWVGCYGASAIAQAPPIVLVPGATFTGADIVVSPQDGFSVEGFLQFDDGSSVDLAKESLVFYSADDNPFPVERHVPVESNGYFRLRGLPPGEYLVISFVQAPQGPGWRAEQELQITGHTSGLRILLRREPPDPER